MRFHTARREAAIVTTTAMQCIQGIIGNAGKERDRLADPSVRIRYSNAFFIIRELSIMCELLFPVAGEAELCLPQYLQQQVLHTHKFIHQYIT